MVMLASKPGEVRQALCIAILELGQPPRDHA